MAGERTERQEGAPGGGPGGRRAGSWAARAVPHARQAPPTRRQRLFRLGSASRPSGWAESRRVRVTSPAGVGRGRRRPHKCRRPRRRVGNGGVFGLHLRHRERQVSESRPPGSQARGAGGVRRGSAAGPGRRREARRAGGGRGGRLFRPRESRAAASCARAGGRWAGRVAGFRSGGAASPAGAPRRPTYRRPWPPRPRHAEAASSCAEVVNIITCREEHT